MDGFENTGTPQHTAKRCSTATYRNTLQHAATEKGACKWMAKETKNVCWETWRKNKQKTLFLSLKLSLSLLKSSLSFHQLVSLSIKFYP